MEQNYSVEEVAKWAEKNALSTAGQDSVPFIAGNPYLWARAAFYLNDYWRMVNRPPDTPPPSYGQQATGL